MSGFVPAQEKLPTGVALSTSLAMAPRLALAGVPIPAMERQKARRTPDSQPWSRPIPHRHQIFERSGDREISWIGVMGVALRSGKSCYSMTRKPMTNDPWHQGETADLEMRKQEGDECVPFVASCERHFSASSS